MNKEYFRVHRYVNEKMGAAMNGDITEFMEWDRNVKRLHTIIENTTPFKKCSNCQLAYYCSRSCQKRDWEKHKAMFGCHRSLSHRVLIHNVLRI